MFTFIRKKKMVTLLGVLCVGGILYACSDEKEMAPTDETKEGEEVVASAIKVNEKTEKTKLMEEKIAAYQLMSEEEVKQKLQSLREDRLNTLQKIVVFLEEAYSGKTQPASFKVQVEKIIDEYQSVYNELFALSKAYKKDEEITNFLHVVTYESTDFVVKFLKEFYQFSEKDGEQFTEALNSLSEEELEGFIEDLQDELDTFTEEDIEDIKDAIDTIFEKKEEVLDGLMPERETVELEVLKEREE